jgi:tetratricopeptide (TPR) repeat protein
MFILRLSVIYSPQFGRTESVMTRLLLAACALFPIFVIPQNAFAQQRVSLTGTIYSEDSKRPIQQAAVRLCDSGGNMIEQTITTDSGEFDFRQLGRTEYNLTVEASGYQSYNLHVDLSFTSDRGISIYLNPNATDPKSASPAANVSAHEMSMPQKARDALESGEKKLYIDKNPQAALPDFQKAVTTAPGFYEAYYQIGMVYLTLGKRDEAEASFRKSIQVSNDKYGEAVIGLASFLIDSGDFAQSETMTRHGLDLSPNAWFGHYQLGRILFNENNIPEALKSAEQARSLAPNAAIVYRLLYKIHKSQNDYSAQLQDLEAYIHLDPDSPAGVRAQELRKQVQDSISKDKLNVAASPTH